MLLSLYTVSDLAFIIMIYYRIFPLFSPLLGNKTAIMTERDGNELEGISYIL